MKRAINSAIHDMCRYSFMVHGVNFLVDFTRRLLGKFLHKARGISRGLSEKSENFGDSLESNYMLFKLHGKCLENAKR